MNGISVKVFPLIGMILVVLASISNGDEIERKPLELTDAAWASLSQAQRDVVGAHYIVEVTASTNFARIVYVQGVDESTPGTTAGAAAGSALAQARYIDKTNVSHYSATKQVGAGLIGAVIGSMLDAPARQQYRHVYTLKDSNGEITTAEKITDSPVYVAPGLCVNLGTFTPVNDNFCDNVFPREIASLIDTAQESAATNPAAIAASTSQPVTTSAPDADRSADDLVTCRFGNTGNIQTTVVKCRQAGGVQKQ